MRRRVWYWPAAASDFPVEVEVVRRRSHTADVRLVHATGLVDETFRALRSALFTTREAAAYKRRRWMERGATG